MTGVQRALAARAAGGRADGGDGNSDDGTFGRQRRGGRRLRRPRRPRRHRTARRRRDGRGDPLVKIAGVDGVGRRAPPRDARLTARRRLSHRRHARALGRRRTAGYAVRRHPPPARANWRARRSRACHPRRIITPSPSPSLSPVRPSAPTAPMKALAFSNSRGSSRRLTSTSRSGRGGRGRFVRVHRVGVCGTDIGGYQGKMPFFSYPRIPGHELGVEVVEVGPGVANVRPGQRCSVEPYMNCGTCYACLQGRRQLLREPAGPRRDDRRRLRDRVLRADKLHPSASLSSTNCARRDARHWLPRGRPLAARNRARTAS